MLGHPLLDPQNNTGLGTGHYLWPGGERSQKWGSVENILIFKEYASKKNQESLSVRLKNSPPKIFAAAAPSFKNLNYPFTPTKNLHNVHIVSVIKHVCFYL